MTDGQNHNLEALGLWGDGDEIAAIEAVEEHFGVTLDTSDATNWHTVGDVFAALLRYCADNSAKRRGSEAGLRPNHLA